MTTSVFGRIDEALAGVPRTGVVHVGAHRGQEVPDYRAAGFAKVVLVEPNLGCRRALLDVDADVVHFVAAGPAGRRVLHVTGWDERSSLLAPVDYRVVRRVEVPVVPLSVLQGGCNVAVLDVQGSELDVLRTGDLGALDAVIVEVSDEIRYQGAADATAIAAFLASEGWLHVSDWPGGHSAGIRDQVWRNPSCVS